MTATARRAGSALAASRFELASGWAFSLLLLAGPSCEPRNEERAAPPPAPATAAVVSAAPTASSAPLPQLHEEAVRRLLDTWLGAQNTVDFVSYARCYAERFTGIKRVGARARRFDREGWLLDRQNMFQPGMRVRAEAVRLEVSATSARVRFTQTFATDTFQDTGEKELLVVATEDGARIAREEMLTSEVAHPRPDQVPLWAVVDGVVHLAEEVEPQLARGRVARREREDGVWVAQRQLDVASLDPRARAWLGKTLVAMGADGKPCETKLVQLLARVDIIPHFGTVQHWQGRTFGAAELAAPRPSAAEIDEELWNLGSFSGVKLAGQLEPACPAALWVSESAPRGGVLVPMAVSAGLRDFLKRSLGALPAAQKIQKVYSESSAERNDKAWLDAARFEVFAFEPKGSLQLAMVSASVGEGCADILEGLTVAFELDVRGDAPRVVRALPLEGVSEVLQVAGALDLDGDGRFELITRDEGLSRTVSYFRPGRSGYSGHELHSVTYLDCPC